MNLQEQNQQARVSQEKSQELIDLIASVNQEELKKEFEIAINDLSIYFEINDLTLTELLRLKRIAAEVIIQKNNEYKSENRYPKRKKA